MTITAQIHDSFTVDVSREHDAKIFAAAFSGVINGFDIGRIDGPTGVTMVHVADEFAASFCAAEDWPQYQDVWYYQMITEFVKGFAKDLSTDVLKNAAIAAIAAKDTAKNLRLAI